MISTHSTFGWFGSGHGSNQTYYSGNPAANFGGADGCKYCHNSTAYAHDYSTGTNFFRLANSTAVVYGGWTNTFGYNGNCMVCHDGNTTPPGYLGKGPASTAARVKGAHRGVKHSSEAANTFDGGWFCWDCHDPHGDWVTAVSTPAAYMFQIAIVELTAGTTQANTAYGVPSSTYSITRFDFSTGTISTAWDYNDYVSSHTFRFVCQSCHSGDGSGAADPGGGATAKYFTRSTWTAPAKHQGEGACPSCHSHNENFAGAGDCLACHINQDKTANGIIDVSSVPWYAGVHSSSNTQADCENCHTGGHSTPRPDEDKCYSAGCHGNVSPAKNLQVVFSTTSRHPIHISTLSVIHPAATNVIAATERNIGAGWLPGPNRSTHSTCVDCHDPHQAKAGTHSVYTSTAGGALYGMWGSSPTYWVTPTSSMTLPSPSTSWVTISNVAGSYEAYLCFKCHSYYGFAYSTPIYSAADVSAGIISSSRPITDQSREFNPKNKSYHAVLGTTTAEAGGTYVGGWSSTRTMTCSDCHTPSTTTYTTKGPHGAGAKRILKAKYDPEGTTAADFALCFLCHDRNTYAGTATTGSNFGNPGNLHTNNIHLSFTTVNGHTVNCASCHSSIPHGWNNKHLIVVAGTPYPYSNGKTGVAARPALRLYTHMAAGTYATGSCETVGDAAGCAGKVHSTY